MVAVTEIETMMTEVMEVVETMEARASTTRRGGMTTTMMTLFSQNLEETMMIGTIRTHPRKMKRKWREHSSWHVALFDPEKKEKLQVYISERYNKDTFPLTIEFAVLGKGPADQKSVEKFFASNGLADLKVESKGSHSDSKTLLYTAIPTKKEHAERVIVLEGESNQELKLTRVEVPIAGDEDEYEDDDHHSERSRSSRSSRSGDKGSYSDEQETGQDHDDKAGGKPTLKKESADQAKNAAPAK